MDLVVPPNFGKSIVSTIDKAGKKEGGKVMPKLK